MGTSRRLLELRRQNGVAQLSFAFGEARVGSLPNGSYGFCTPWSARIGPRDSHDEFESRVTLSRARMGTASTEIHKAADGLIYIVGFLSPDGAAAFRSPRDDRALELRMSVEGGDGWTEVVAVPLEAVYRMRSCSLPGVHRTDGLVVSIDPDLLRFTRHHGVAQQ